MVKASSAAITLLEDYTRALQEYFAGGGDTALQRASELSSQALSKGIGILEVMHLHHEQMISVVLSLTGSEQSDRGATAARMFCASCPASQHQPDDLKGQVRVAPPPAAGDPAPSHAVLRRINETLEQEARRIGLALHDEAGQMLTVVYLKLAEASHDVPARCQTCFREIEILLHQIEDKLRLLSHELRPPMLDDLGLVPALQSLSNGVSRRTGLAVSFEATMDGRLPPDIEAALYRIVQEALNNVVKHARASRARVRLERDTAVHCHIEDDGVGFNVREVMMSSAGRGLGLVGIQERIAAIGGSLSILSAPDAGTEVSVTVPA